MKKKRIYTEEQKARNKICSAEYRLKNKAKNKIYQAKWYLENKEEVKQQTQEWYKNNPEKYKAKTARFKEKNPGYKKEWDKKNPNYAKEWFSQHDLGYWVVYLIHNFDGLGNIYCGQTQNIYSRMVKHKSKGVLNSDKYELIKQCETREDALAFEAYMHEQGYHGKSAWTFI